MRKCFSYLGYWIIVFIVAVNLCGCNGLGSYGPTPENEKDKNAALSVLSGTSNLDNQNQKQTGKTKEARKEEDNNSNTPNSKDNKTGNKPSYKPNVVIDDHAGDYYYNVISDKDKELYNTLFLAIVNEEEGVKVNTNNTDKISEVFQFVLLDHPDIYYVDGFSYRQFLYGEEIDHTEVSASYTVSNEDRALYDTRLNSITKATIDRIKSLPNDYEKVKAAYEYVITNTEYDLGSTQNQNILSVFFYGRSVCQGYAKAFQYLLLKAGVPCSVVVGTVEGGERHAWNLVYADGAYYYVDVTWGDQSYQEAEIISREKKAKINYDFLMVTDEIIGRKHTPDTGAPYPKSTSLEDNYYMKNDAYFTQLDKEKLGRLFEKGYDEKAETVSLMCSDKNVYNQILAFLIEDKALFKLVPTTGTQITYAQNDELYVLTVWL